MKSEMERVHRPRWQARQGYNSMSRWYDLFTSSEKRFTDIGIQMLDVQPNESILEIGCGTGHALVEFSNHSRGGKVVAIDISEGMLKTAHGQTKSQIVEYCQADGLSLPFSNKQFDAVFTSFTLEGQACILDDYLEIRKEMKPRLEALISAGRIQIGPFYVQNDPWIQTGEGYIRILLADIRPSSLV